MSVVRSFKHSVISKIIKTRKREQKSFNNFLHKDRLNALANYSFSSHTYSETVARWLFFKDRETAFPKHLNQKAMYLYELIYVLDLMIACKFNFLLATNAFQIILHSFLLERIIDHPNEDRLTIGLEKYFCRGFHALYIHDDNPLSCLDMQKELSDFLILPFDKNIEKVPRKQWPLMRLRKWLKKYNKVSFSAPWLIIPTNEYSDFSATHLNDAWSIITNSILQKNCSKSFLPDIINNEMQMYSLDYKGEKYTLALEMTQDPIAIFDLKGYANIEAPYALYDMIRKHLKIKNESINNFL